MAFACAVVGYMAPMTTSNVRSGTSRSGTNADTHRANPLGAYIATLGALILLASVWLDWVGLGIADSETNSSSGYEADSLIPFMGLLGLGFALALLYATKRADRRQHRGLSLASFAVGLASLLWIVFFIIDPIETVKYAGYDGESEPNVTTELGAYIGLLGALIWTVGSFLLAKEPEGDVEQVSTHRVETHARPVQHTQHTQVTETRPANVTDRDVVDRRPTNTRTVGETHTTGRTVQGTDYDADRIRRNESGTR
jgi:hypothetical protein